MSMVITLKTELFRGDYDQARSQYSLLWFMEAMCRVNQSHIRQMRNLKERGKITKDYPLIYRSGIHYERERGTEEWLDIPTILKGGSYPGEFPGAWDDCLPLSTLVLKDDMNFVPIGQLAPGDRIMGNGEWTTVLEYMEKGRLPVLAFELDNGSIFRCTAEHRLFKADGTVIKAGEVRPGEQLLTPTQPFPTKPEPIVDSSLSPKDFAWLLGVYIADGWHNLPRHPRFAISGRDGKPKEEQKRRVETMMKAAGIGTYWNDRYIGVNDRRLATIMATCGGHAPDKHVPVQYLSHAQIRELLEGLAADATTSSGPLTYGTTSVKLALQLRLLYRMLGQSTHIRRWDDHGGLGKHPIYRIGVRKTVEEASHPRHAKLSARVLAVREDGEEECCDIETDTKKFWLPESDLVVHNCEGVSCWRVAELREFPFHYVVRSPRDGKPLVLDPYSRPPAGARRINSGIKAKPFAKFRQRDDGSYAYHALVLLPDGRLEDPSLTLGMGWEKDFYNQGLAEKYKNGQLPVQIRYAESPDTVVVDPESPTGFSSAIGRARMRTGLAGDCSGPSCSNMTPEEMGFRSGRLGRLGRIGNPEANWAQRFGHIATAISVPPISAQYPVLALPPRSRDKL